MTSNPFKKPQWAQQFNVEEADWQRIFEKAEQEKSTTLDVALDMGLLNENKVLEWDREISGLPSLQDVFFNAEPPVDLWKDLNFETCRAHACMPVASWDGKIYWAKISSEASAPDEAKDAVFVLAPWTGLKKWFAKWEESVKANLEAISVSPEKVDEFAMPVGISAEAKQDIQVDFSNIGLAGADDVTPEPVIEEKAEEQKPVKKMSLDEPPMLEFEVDTSAEPVAVAAPTEQKEIQSAAPAVGQEEPFGQMFEFDTGTPEPVIEVKAEKPPSDAPKMPPPPVPKAPPKLPDSVELGQPIARGQTFPGMPPIPNLDNTGITKTSTKMPPPPPSARAQTVSNTVVPPAKPIGATPSISKMPPKPTGPSPLAAAMPSVPPNTIPGTRSISDVTTVGLEQLEGKLKGAANQDELASTFIGAWQNYFDKVMILLFRDENLIVWWHNNKWRGATVRGQQIPVDTPSIFKIVVDTQRPYHGYVTPGAVNDLFFKSTNNGEYPEHVTIIPVVAGNRVVAMCLGTCSKETGRNLSLPKLEESGRQFATALMKVVSPAQKAS